MPVLEVIERRVSNSAGFDTFLLFTEESANWIKILFCSICEESLREYHYKCLQCHFDICTSCQRKELHMEHLMVRFHPSFNRCVNFVLQVSCQ